MKTRKTLKSCLALLLTLVMLFSVMTPMMSFTATALTVDVNNVGANTKLTSKTDYEIFVDGTCTNLDVNQFKAKTVVHLKSADNYKILNNGRKCNVITRVNGETVEFSANENAENTISTSGLFSELIVEV